MAPVKKNTKMFMSANTKTTEKLQDKTVDLKEAKDLYGRLMVLAKSSRDINQKEVIGNFEFTLTPRALFFSRRYYTAVQEQIEVDPPPQQVVNNTTTFTRR